MFFTGAKRRHYELTLVSSNRMIPHYHLNLFFRLELLNVLQKCVVDKEKLPC